jgi:hypothetical protein
MTKVTEVKVTPVVALKSACIEFTKAQASVDKASKKADTMTDSILVVAVAAGSLTVWDTLRDELDKHARTLTKSQKVSMGYVVSETKDSGGNITLQTGPGQYLAVIFSTVRQTYKRSLPFGVKNIKTGEFEAYTHHALKVNKSADQTKKLKKAKGRAGDMRDLAAIQKLERARVKNMNDEDLHNLIVRRQLEVNKLPTSKAA